MDRPGAFKPGNERFERIQAYFSSILALPFPLANLVDAPAARLHSQHRTKELLNKLDRILSVLQTDPGVDATQATEQVWTEDHMMEALLGVGFAFDNAPNR